MKASVKNQRRSYFEVQQPFDLFEDLPVASQQSLYRRPPPKRSPSTKIWAVIGFFLLVAVGGWGVFKLQEREAKPPFVLVELRAVSPKGNPLAGAQVQLGEHKMGVTDSFGEWRRYLRLRPGAKIRVRMTKVYQGYSFAAETILEVPSTRSDGKEAELKSTLALKLNGDKNKPTPASSELQGSSPRATMKSQASSRFRVKSSYLSQNHLTSLDIRHVKVEGELGSLMERHQSAVLRNRIIPELIAQMDEQGVRLDRQAGWKFLLSYIPHADQVGFIRGELIWRDHRGRPQKNSFLTTFAKTVEESARALLQMAKRQVNKQYGASYHNGHWYVADINEPEYWRLTPHTILLDPTGETVSLRQSQDSEGRPVWQLLGSDGRPCKTIAHTEECPLSTPSLREQPPHPRWTAQQLHIQGSLPERADIYVSGYQAYPVRSNQWAYWGDASSEVMVTVIQNQRIYHRVRLSQPQSGQPLVLNLPGHTAHYTPPAMPRRF